LGRWTHSIRSKASGNSTRLSTTGDEARSSWIQASNVQMTVARKRVDASMDIIICVL